MRPQEFVDAVKLAMREGTWPKPLPRNLITKEMIMEAARRSEPPWTKEEVTEVMHALGLQPGYD